MTDKQADMRWLVSELLQGFALSRDFAPIHDLLECTAGFEREVLLESVFWISLQEGDWQLAENCLQEGYSILPDPSDAADAGPLHVAMQNLGECSAVIEWLLSHGTDVERRGQSNTTPLMYAAGQGWYRVTEALLAGGANVNASTIIDDDSDALILAAANGHRDIVRLLISHGADRSHREKYNGLTAAELADSHGEHNLANFIRGRR
jgi:hypothetical protein